VGSPLDDGGDTVAYDEGLAQRVREAVGEAGDGEEKKMFGGLCVLLGGNMALGIVGDELMVRVGPEAYAEALALPGAREMDFTGRSLKGFVYVSADVLAEDGTLAEWVRRGVTFARSLPPKPR
jgi:TfoX/Sxy family transcriptional regulator of competence genes